MAKFKVGDRVKAKRDIGEYFTSGREYEIQNEDSYYINDDKGSVRHVASLDFLAEEFDQVFTPIRTVTRREIVPGTYNGVVIAGVGVSNKRVSVGMDTLFRNTDELREAAHLFNQIAEVLEENAKEAA